MECLRSIRHGTPNLIELCLLETFRIRLNENQQIILFCSISHRISYCVPTSGNLIEASTMPLTKWDNRRGFQFFNDNINSELCALCSSGLHRWNIETFQKENNKSHKVNQFQRKSDTKYKIRNIFHISCFWCVLLVCYYFAFTVHQSMQRERKYKLRVSEFGIHTPGARSRNKYISVEIDEPFIRHSTYAYSSLFTFHISFYIFRRFIWCFMFDL